MDSNSTTQTEEALRQLLLELTQRIGVSRLGNITGLDEIGLPTYQAIRPGAELNGLCVHSGKGITHVSAQISALMEALEHHWAEGRHHLHEFETMRPGRWGVDVIRSLVPYSDSLIDPDLPIAWTACRSLTVPSHIWLPAEVVFHPLNGQSHYYFGTETRGLAAGTTIESAALHGLLEVVEHDARALAHLTRNALAIPLSATRATAAAGLIDRFCEVGLDCRLALLPTDVAIAVVACTIIERGASDPLRMNHGYCAALNPDDALTGAVMEAAQSRLGLIAGSRDDFPERARHMSYWDSLDDRRASYSYLLEPDEQQTWTDMVDRSGGTTVEQLLRVVELTTSVTGADVFWRELTPECSPVRVVRVIAPGLQPKIEHRPRLGQRAVTMVARGRR